MPNDDTSLGGLYRRYGPHVYKRCLYLLQSEEAAWDAVQDIFIKAEQARDRFEGRSSWGTWLVRIATYHCLNQLRAGRVRLGQGHVPVEDLGREGRFTGDTERAVLVRDLLSRFDPQTQAVAIHYYVDEMSQEEVALAVGLSVPTVRKRLRQFVAKARRDFELGRPLAEAG